jgi:excisionase family DNA binding protein
MEYIQERYHIPGSVGMAAILTLAEVSERFKISISQVQKLAREGKIPAHKIGRLWRFDEEELSRWFYGATSDLHDVRKRARERARQIIDRYVRP